MKSLSILKDKKFMTDFFWKQKDLIDKRIKKIISLDIKKIKFYEDENFKHAVMHYNLRFYDDVNWQQYLNIYASAHSDGSRKRSYAFMKYIHENGFDLNNYYSSTKPLFYDKSLKASFHEELMGENISYIIRKYPRLVNDALGEAGKCLAQFHRIPNPDKLKLKKYPFSRSFLDPSDIIKKKTEEFPEVIELVEKTFKTLEKYYKKNKQIFNSIVFAHGDFHFENIIIGTDFENNPLPFKKVGIIDYTDICAADRGLDLGGFMQKINFLTTYKLNYSEAQVFGVENLFLNNYLKNSGTKMTEELETSILFWKTWNNLRVIINYMLFPEKKEAMEILKKSLKAYSQELFK